MLLGGFVMRSEAQIQLGIKGGLNVSELMTSKDQYLFVNGNKQTVKNFPNSEWNGGLVVSIPLKKNFSLQPEVLYSVQGATAKPSYGYLVSSSEEYKLGYLNIPILLKYNSPVGVFLETGPQFGLLLNAKVNETVVGAAHTVSYDVKGQFKSTDIGWALGAGYLSPIDLGIDIRYTLGLTNISNASAAGMQVVPVQNGNMKNGVLQITLFYLFGKSGLPHPKNTD